MKTFFNKTIETALNRYLALDPESRQRLLLLEGKVILIVMPLTAALANDNAITLTLNIHNGKINVSASHAPSPDVIIKGTPLSLLHMSLNKENRKQFFAEDVVMEGNLELGQQIIDLFDAMEIDWEEHSSRVLGDVSAHQLGRFVKGVKSFVNKTRESILQNINEYVHEEALVFPPREALNDFFHDIDALRMDADRLEIRIKNLLERRGMQ